MKRIISLLTTCIMVFGSFAYANNDMSEQTAVQEAYGKLPLYFVRNAGQLNEKVKYYEKGSGHSTFFTKEGVFLGLVKDNGADSTVGRNPVQRDVIDAAKAEVVKLAALGANKDPEIVAEELLEGKVNYLTGNDPGKWKTGIQTYKTIVYKELYKGIDMKFYGNNSQLEYDVVVKPGADPSTIRLSYEGVENLKVTENGEMEIGLKDGAILQSRPVIYQDIDGKRVEIEGKYKILKQEAQNQAPSSQQRTAFVYGFEVASYDKSHPLIIDPVIAYSTYLGGTGGDDGYSIAVDSSGNAYITGRTYSTDFPTVSPVQGSHGGGGYDVFITKINPSGSAIVYSTYLGGSGQDEGYGIAVDAFGNAYVTGITESINFPTASPIYGSHAGYNDAFVAKINSSGTALVYSTYLGGSDNDSGWGIAVDTNGNAYVTGGTASVDFPIASAIYGSNSGGNDAFVTKINGNGTALVYSTYLGGSSNDDGYGIKVDTSGNAYIAGHTNSTNFPTASPIYASNAGGYDIFVTKVNASGSALVYSTYLGGSGNEWGTLAIDASGAAYLTGDTSSTNFPTVIPIQGTIAGGNFDAYVSKINASGSALVYSTYLGGSSDDSGYGIAVDPSGNAYITGPTNSTNFTLANPIYGSLSGVKDAFVSKINTAGSALVYSTYLGGNGADEGWGIAVDASGNGYITGNTYSADFPMVAPIDGTYGGRGNAFVAKIAPDVTGCVKLKGAVIVGSTVTLKQTAVPTQNTTTNSEGCYHFDRAVSGKTFTVTIDGPMVP